MRVAEQFYTVAEFLDLDIVCDAVVGASCAIQRFLVPGLLLHALLRGVALVDVERTGMLVRPERVGEEVVAASAHVAI